MISNRNLGKTQTGMAENFESDQYKRYSWMVYELYLQPHIIQRYLSRLIEVQKIEEFLYYPVSKDRFINYCSILAKDFESKHLIYDSSTNLNLISRIVSNLGKSGLNYISSVNDIIDVNKPVLLHYGIEHLSAFYLNLHFNFTEGNKKLNQIGDKLFKHGIDPYEFKRISVSTSSKKFLLSRIKLTKFGLAPRFFLLLDFPFEKFFLEEFTISLIDLMTTFFTRLPLGNPYKISGEFTSENVDLDLSDTKFGFFEQSQDIDLFVLYSLSFIFSYMGRYKISAFEKFLNDEERTLAFYLRTIMKRIQDLYIRKIFSIILYNNDEIIFKLRKLHKKIS